MGAARGGGTETEARRRTAQDRVRTEVSRVETWLLDQGVPAVVRYAAGQRIISRITPGLMLIFVSGLGLLAARLLSGDLQRPFWEVLASTEFTSQQAALSGAVIMLGFGAGVAAAVGISRVRERTERSGARTGLVLVAGMVAICLVHGLIATSVAAFLAELVTFALLVVVLFLFVRSGVSALLVWAARRAVPRYRDLVLLLTRALPLQLVLVAFLFIADDAWLAADRLDRSRLVGLMIFFVVAALLFLITQIPRELRSISVELSEEQVRRGCAGTPLERLAGTIDIAIMRKHPLSAKERLNLVLNVMFTQGLQVLSLGLLMFVILVGFGVIAIQQSVIEIWVGRPAEPIIVFGLQLPLITAPLLKVAALVSAFTALQFAVQAVTDAGYRTDFFDDVLGQLSHTLLAREVYLAGLEQHQLTPSSRRFSWRDLDET